MLRHTPFLLVGDYTPTPTERRIYSAPARSANTFEGMPNCRLLCRDVANHPMYVWCPLIKGLTSEDGMAIYHPIRRYNFPQKGGAKGVLKFLTPLLRKDTARSILTGMSRNATYPMEQTIPPSLLYQINIPRPSRGYFLCGQSPLFFA